MSNSGHLSFDMNHQFTGQLSPAERQRNITKIFGNDPLLIDEYLKTLSDKHLIALLNAFADIPEYRKRIFRTIYLRYYQQTFKFSLKKTNNKAEAEAVFSITWNIVLNKLYQYDCDAGQPKIQSWLFAIIRNQALKLYKDSDYETDLDVNDEGTWAVYKDKFSYIDQKLEYGFNYSQDYYSEQIKNDADVIVAATLKEMKPRDRKLITLYYFPPPITTEELAKIMKMTPGATRTALNRARNKFRSIIDDYEIGTFSKRFSDEG